MMRLGFDFLSGIVMASGVVCAFDSVVDRLPINTNIERFVAFDDVLSESPPKSPLKWPLPLAYSHDNVLKLYCDERKRFCIF